MKRPFDECWERIKRAKLHREASAHAWNAFIDSDPYAVRSTVYSDGTGGIWVEQVKPVPPEIAFEIGEFLYQMRAALDHVIYETARVESRQDPPPNQEKLEFIFRASADKFRDAGWKLGPLTQEQRDVVESVQPYMAPKDLKPHELPYSYHRGLLMLNDWARMDRHRKLHVVGSWTSNINPVLVLPPGATLLDLSVNVRSFMLKDESQIAAFRIGGWNASMNMYANPNLSFDPTVDEAPLPCHDVDTLDVRYQCIIRAVVNVIERMAATMDPKLWD